MNNVFKNVTITHKLLLIVLGLMCTKSYTKWGYNISAAFGNYLHYCNNTYRSVGLYEDNPPKFWQILQYTSLNACAQDWRANGTCRNTTKCGNIRKLVSPHKLMWRQVEASGRAMEDARQRGGFYNHNFGKL